MPFSRRLFLSLLLLLSISICAGGSDDTTMTTRTLLAERSRKWKRSIEREQQRFVDDLDVEEEEKLAAAPAPWGEDPPLPPLWPEKFHAVLVQYRNGSSSLVDLFYDWRRGRNANLIRKQLDSGTVVDLEYSNHTSFYFDRSRPERGCRRVDFPVGILTPDWLSGARYLGVRTINGFECRGWAKGQGRPASEDFVHYWARISDNVPVRWTFRVGEPMEMNVYSFRVGGEMPEEGWQAPSWCF